MHRGPRTWAKNSERFTSLPQKSKTGFWRFGNITRSLRNSSKWKGRVSNASPVLFFFFKGSTNLRRILSLPWDRGATRLWQPSSHGVHKITSCQPQATPGGTPFPIIMHLWHMGKAFLETLFCMLLNILNSDDSLYGFVCAKYLSWLRVIIPLPELSDLECDVFFLVTYCLDWASGLKG